MIEINKVYNDDCFNIISQLDDESIDLVLTDPPYGDNSGYGRNNKQILNNEDETINYKFIKEIYPKMKNNTSMYIFTNHKFSDKIKEYALSIGMNYKMMCILVKNNFGMGGAFRNQYEICLVLEKGMPEYHLLNMSNVWHMNHIEFNENNHPHTKEVKLLQKIIKHSSKKNDLIFDGFAGSFSVPKACVLENRNFIATELDKKWCDLSMPELEKIQKSKQKKDDIFNY